MLSDCTAALWTTAHPRPVLCIVTWVSPFCFLTGDCLFFSYAGCHVMFFALSAFPFSLVSRCFVTCQKKAFLIFFLATGSKH